MSKPFQRFRRTGGKPFKRFSHCPARYTALKRGANEISCEISGLVTLERKIDRQIARKRGQIKSLANGQERETLEAMAKAKTSGRAFVEHPRQILKHLFRHRKVRYRGLAKNGHQLYTLVGLVNVSSPALP